MAKGTVKWFNAAKGYGFIQPQGGGGKDVFVHISAVERAGLSSLNEGQTVEYEEVSNKGRATGGPQWRFFKLIRCTWANDAVVTNLSASYGVARALMTRVTYQKRAYPHDRTQASTDACSSQPPPSAFGR
jgi:CspA family cold shock protein